MKKFGKSFRAQYYKNKEKRLRGYKLSEKNLNLSSLIKFYV